MRLPASRRLVVPICALCLIAAAGSGCDGDSPKQAAAPPAAPARPVDPAVVTDPKTIQRIKDLKKVEGDVRIPEALVDTPLAKEYARWAAPHYKQYGAERTATVLVMGISTADTTPFLTMSRSLELAASPPVIQQAPGAQTGDCYVVIAPVKDLDAVAKKLVAEGYGTLKRIDAETRVIVLDAPGTAAE